jgi:hypothetical protein
VNDLVVHPRDNDLILGTHGRGIWILDHLNPLQELTPEVLASPAHLFSMEPAEQIRYRSEKGHAGDMVFRGENPAPGALIDYWLGPEVGDVSLSILEAGGRIVARVRATNRPGLNRVTWNLRQSEPDQEGAETPRGPLVVPGTYTVRVEVDGVLREQPLVVREDPRIQVDEGTRRAWTQHLLALGALARDAGSGADEMQELAQRVQADSTLPEELMAGAEELERQWNELRTRTRSLMREVEGWVGAPTEDQRAREAYYREMVGVLRDETAALARRVGGEPGLEDPS